MKLISLTIILFSCSIIGLPQCPPEKPRPNQAKDVRPDEEPGSPAEQSKSPSITTCSQLAGAIMNGDSDEMIIRRLNYFREFLSLKTLDQLGINSSSHQALRAKIEPFALYFEEGQLDTPTHFASVKLANSKSVFNVDRSTNDYRTAFQNVAYVAEEKGKKFVVASQQPNPSYQGSDEVTHIRLSSDGKQVAYASRHGNKRVLVLNETTGKEKEFDDVGPPVFSPDGRRVAYQASDRRKRFILSDGIAADGKTDISQTQRSGEYDDVRTPVFSPDGSRVAFAASDRNLSSANKWFVAVCDSQNLSATACQKQNAYVEVKHPVLGPAGTLAFAAKGGSWFVVAGGREYSAGYEDIKELVLSPDGSAVAYAVKLNNKWAVNLGNAAYGKGFEDVGPIVFSKDGKHISYAAKSANAWFVMFDDKRQLVSIGDELQEDDFDEVSSIDISPDGSTVAYAARKCNKWQIVVGDKLMGQADEAYAPIFSLNGVQVMYGARQGVKFFRKVAGPK